jgi:hypothetical protein
MSLPVYQVQTGLYILSCPATTSRPTDARSES